MSSTTTIYRFNQIDSFKGFFSLEKFDTFRLPIISVKMLLNYYKSESI